MCRRQALGRGDVDVLLDFDGSGLAVFFEGDEPPLVDLTLQLRPESHIVAVAGGLGAGDSAGGRDDEGKVKPNIATADATFDGHYAMVGLDRVGARGLVVNVRQRWLSLVADEESGRGEEQGRQEQGRHRQEAQHDKHRI